MALVLGSLFLVAISTTLSIILCEISGPLNNAIAAFSLTAGFISAVGIYIKTRSVDVNFKNLTFTDYVIGLAYFLVCFRFLIWIYFSRNHGLYTLDVNNFGDLPWHVTIINNLVLSKFWPANPIFAAQNLHYPFGIDMFCSLFVKLGAPLTSVLPAVSFYSGVVLLWALFLWGGSFAVGSFLFSGGVAGYEILRSGIFKDYQADLAWKNLPLAVYFTQRGFMYALPAGLILLWAWQKRFVEKKPTLPFFIEGLLWGLLPLFHVHTFIFISFIFAVWVLYKKKYRDGAALLSWSFLPATYEILRLTDKFKMPSLLSFRPGWMIGGQNVFAFFWLNYGFYCPLIMITLYLAFRAKDRAALLLLIPAGAVYTVCLFILFAPWDWDNTKLMIWSYLLVLPVIYDLTLARLDEAKRALVLAALFFSGFVCLYTYYQPANAGFELYSEAEIDGVCGAIKNLPHENRFATAQVHNHPVLICGHMVSVGYEGHLWSHGIPNYQRAQENLRRLMLGDQNWRELARAIDARYIFWGSNEQRIFGTSVRPWEAAGVKIAEGAWGKIYDLGD